MCWGFEVGDGWFNIINNLSHLLCDDCLRAKNHYHEVKDRLGKQRFDFDLDKSFNTIVTQEEIDESKRLMDEMYEKTPIASQVKEKFGTLRFYVDNTTEEHEAMIHFAEMMSAVTCEVCGDKGKRRGSYWISTRCEKHSDT
jgi:hypothetical protein